MDVKILEVAGLASAFSNMALAQRKSPRSSIITTIPNKSQENNNFLEYGSSVALYPKDIENLRDLLMKKRNAAKPIKSIVVWLRIKATRRWWQEVLKNVGVRALFADSSLLVIMKQLLNKNSFSHIDTEVLNRLNAAIVEQDREFVKNTLPDTFFQTRDITVDYPTLTHIYNQYKTSTDSEWMMFIQALKNLPFGESFILYEQNEVNTDNITI